jgi:hypothetical protein
MSRRATLEIHAGEIPSFADAAMRVMATVGESISVAIEASGSKAVIAKVELLDDLRRLLNQADETAVFDGPAVVEINADPRLIDCVLRDAIGDAHQRVASTSPTEPDDLEGHAVDLSYFLGRLRLLERGERSHQQQPDLPVTDARGQEDQPA